MSRPNLNLLDTPAALRTALSPLRRTLLAHLREPGSAATLAATLGLTRQKVGYHLRLLDDAGLLAPAGERRRRGFTEKLFVARADAFLVDPAILGDTSLDDVDKQDRHAADHLVRAAAATVRDVTRMRAAAEAEGSRLLTFTIETEVSLATPADLHHLADRLAAAVAKVSKDFDAGPAGRRHRLVLAAHPAVGDGPNQIVN